MRRSRANPEDLPPAPLGALHLTFKATVTERQRRALGARQELDGGRRAGARDCTVALERAVTKYLEQLDREGA